MSITKKVTLIVCLLAGLMLSASGYAVMLLREKETQILVSTYAKLLSSVIKASAEIAERDFGHFGVLEDLVSRSMAARITFYGADARMTAPVPTEEQPVINAMIRRVMKRDRPEEQTDVSAYVYRFPLHLRGKVDGAVEVRMDRSHFRPKGLLPGGLITVGSSFSLFALLVALFSYRSMGKPIHRLMIGMDHVIRGDLTHILPLDRNDEIGRIAYRFNEMTAQLRDAQEKIRTSAQATLQLEQQLRQSEKLATIGQLAAEIAHEVGTPLNVISGRARNLGRKAEQPGVVQKNASIIAEQATRITRIIQQMLDLSRRRVPTRTQVDVVQSIQAALLLLEHQIVQNRIEVLNRIPRDIQNVMGDADGLQQVFINLLLNAIQAMPDGGTLTIEAQVTRRRKGGLDLAPPQSYLSVRVSDTGVGIDGKMLDQIFEPFYSTKDKGVGTGLGLTVVHGLVKQHDGWIDVEQHNPGTSFIVHLPTGLDAEQSERREISGINPLPMNPLPNERTKNTAEGGSTSDPHSTNAPRVIRKREASHKDRRGFDGSASETYPVED